jgi:hypothetical protein
MDICTTGGWRKLRNQLHTLINSRNIIRLITSKRLTWARHVERTLGLREMRTKFCHKREWRRPFWVSSVDDRIIK